jgi:Predicted redox protein, regulator of disulfide bond formation
MVEFSIVYKGGLRCEAVHGPSGAILPTDAPTDNLGRGEAFSPTDLCATSLGTCMVTTMAIYAERKGFEFPAGAALAVRKIMTSTPPRRIARIEADITVPLPEGHPERAELERVARNCPVALSLHPDIEQVLIFRWVG